ncbi:hypothetical protein POM88_045509 [Heracleum sosnowskyi]|uniref:DNA helicase n=1 Tax=Heracleum sosnowskyi TaxID=360622 RepID=A0AAD8M3X0_9APIA|nr:hypothetical protein POM88_045509 [Heracleum sosnowskyi]
MDPTTRKKGRPKVVVTDSLIEARRLAKQQHTARRSGGNILASSSLASTCHTTPQPVRRRGGVSAAKSPRRRTRIDKKKSEFGKSPSIYFLKKAESTGKHMGTGPKAYSICCGKGKVQLPLLRETPPELKQLLTGTSKRETKFQNNQRMYNTIFALCSFGGRVDESINNGSGPYVFRLNDHVYHSMGSLVPPDGRTPKFAHFYMYDGHETIDYRVQFPRSGDPLDPKIVALLLQILTRDNVLVGIYKQLRERYPISQQIHVTLRLLERRSTDGRFVNLIGRNDYEFAGLAVDHDLASHRDIIVQYKQGGLQRITELHPCFMSLQYPLLFPRGEDGYRLAVDVGKRVVLPSSFTGGFRYMQQNFQDSLAICKEYGHPDLFVTFTCNPKWVEIQRALAAAGSTDASVRPDLVARVFKIKLDAMMSDFMKKDVVGRVLTAVYTIEFQKRVECNKIHLDNRHVVPYNRGLLVKYQAYIDVVYSGDPIKAIVDEIYADLNEKHGCLDYLCDRAILTPLNEYMDKINQEVLKRLPGTTQVYKRCDTICKGSSTNAFDEVLYPPEYLNSLKFSGLPNHELEIKLGVPIMLLRNLNPKKGLCNGTRLIVTRCYPFLIEGLIITGNKIGEKHTYQEYV